MTNTPRTKRKATLREGHLIGKMLDQVLKVVTPKTEDTPAYVEYIEGYDDAVVAAKCSEHNDPTLSPASVAGIRTDFYGLIKAPPMEHNDDAVWGILSTLQENVESIEKRATLSQNDALSAKKEARVVTEALNKVIAMLATNKVIDCGALLIRAMDGSIPGVARAPHNGG